MAFGFEPRVRDHAVARRHDPGSDRRVARSGLGEGVILDPVREAIALVAQSAETVREELVVPVQKIGPELVHDYGDDQARRLIGRFRGLHASQGCEHHHRGRYDAEGAWISLAPLATPTSHLVAPICRLGV